MQENNYEYLAKQLKYTGFGDEIATGLKEQMLTGSAQFSLQHQAVYGRDQANATLQFRKPEGSDMYFFNSYRLEVEKGNSSEAMGQIFYINGKEDNVTLKEAYNLLQGRAVQKEFTPKEGERYNAWMQLDFKNIDDNSNFIVKKFHQNYGFDLGAELNKHAIKELSNEDNKKMLMQSLERGNRQSVNYVQGDVEKKFYIEAAPQFKSVNIYDEDMKRVRPQLTTDETKSQEQTTKKDQKKEITTGEEQGSNKATNKPKTKRTHIS